MSSAVAEPTSRPRLAGPAVLITLVQVVGTTIAARGSSADLDVWGYLLLAVSGLALASRAVPAMVVLTAAATLAYDTLDYPSGPTYLALIVAVAVGLRAGRRGVVWTTALITFVAWVLLTGATRAEAVTLAAWALGIGLLVQLLLVIAAGIRRMLREEQRLKEERRRRQASEERLRIASELHDVLGHHLSLINIRAGVGRHLMDQQPDEARAALDTIKDASAEALREVQTVLNTLYPTGESAPLAPAPGLARLDELTVDAGLPVHTTTTGEPRPLPAEVDRAAYRIVQEALTNVRRHAGRHATAAITIEYLSDALLLEVADDGGSTGPVVGPTTDGNGITGMRERALALGGSLTAGAAGSGGWRVSARLPLPADEPVEPVEPGVEP